MSFGVLTLGNMTSTTPSWGIQWKLVIPQETLSLSASQLIILVHGSFTGELSFISSLLIIQLMKNLPSATLNSTSWSMSWRVASKDLMTHIFTKGPCHYIRRSTRWRCREPRHFWFVVLSVFSDIFAHSRRSDEWDQLCPTWDNEPDYVKEAGNNTRTGNNTTNGD